MASAVAETVAVLGRVASLDVKSVCVQTLSMLVRLPVLQPRAALLHQGVSGRPTCALRARPNTIRVVRVKVTVRTAVDVRELVKCWGSLHRPPPRQRLPPLHFRYARANVRKRAFAVAATVVVNGQAAS